MKQFLLKLSFCLLIVMSFTNCSRDIDTPDTIISSCIIDKYSKFSIYSPNTANESFVLYDNNKISRINSADGGFVKLIYSGENLIKVEGYNNPSDMEMFIEISYSSNNIGQLKLHEQNSSGVLRLYSVIEYEYDSRGRRIKRIDKVPESSGELILDYTTDYTYDELGNIVKMEERDEEGVLDGTSTFSYNNKENTWANYSKQFDAIGWLIIGTGIDDLYAHNTDAMFLSKYQLIKDQNLSQENNYSYQYDTRGNVLQIISDTETPKVILQYKCE